MKKIFIILIFLLCVFSLDINPVTNAINYWKYYKNFTINIEKDIIDMYMNDSVSYTVTQVNPPFKSKIYIDYVKFLYAPTTLFNVILHEIGHFLGKYHNNDIKSIMNYSIKVDVTTGFVIEDKLRILSKKDICL